GEWSRGAISEGACAGTADSSGRRSIAGGIHRRPGAPPGSTGGIMTATFTKTPAPSPGISVERIADVPGFEALRDEWGELLESSDADCLFLTWEWLSTWWKHLAGDRRLAILAPPPRGR